MQFLLIAIFTAGLVQAQPTYSREVSRILDQKCTQCHRPKDIAPFSLTSFEDAQTFAEDIKRVVTDRIMPPWKPVEGFGDFEGNYGLTDDERRTILDWIEAGAPQGDPAELPEPQPEAGEWRLGTPDMILQPQQSFTPKRGNDVYRCFVVTNPFDETMYVTAMDVLPGAKQIVHHVILYIDERNLSPGFDAKEDGEGYTCFGGPGFTVTINSAVGGWAPGAAPRHLPKGLAVQVPKGARLVMQVHYSPKVVAEDLTRVGLYFATEKPQKLVRYVPVLNTSFRIPPGASRHEVVGRFAIPPGLDGQIIQIFPHMHLLGREIKVELTPLARETVPLMYIDNWDFNWQGFYNYKEQIRMPSLSTLKVTCVFDNSDQNPRNPSNPLKEVRWGEETQDEMCLAFLGVTFDNENLLNIFLPNQKKKSQ